MSPCSSHTSSPPPLSAHHTLPHPVVVLRCAESTTIHIDLSEGKEDPVPFTIESQDQLDKQLLRTGASGLMNGTYRAILKVEELVDGDAYTMLYDTSSKLTKLEGGVKTLQGTLKTIDEAFERDVSPCPAVLSLSFFLSFFLPPSPILSFAHLYTPFSTFRRRSIISILF